MFSWIYCTHHVIRFCFFEAYAANSGWSNWCWSCSTEHFRDPTFPAQLHFSVSRRVKGKSTCFWNWPVEQLIDICSLVNVKYGVTTRFSCQVRNSKCLISYLHYSCSIGFVFHKWKIKYSLFQEILFEHKYILKLYII